MAITYAHRSTLIVVVTTATVNPLFPTTLPIRKFASFLGQLARVKPLDLSTAAKAEVLPLDTQVEEESRQDYDPTQFYPVKLGELFREAYQVAVKVGFGGHSTVWLARNLLRYALTGLHSECH